MEREQTIISNLDLKILKYLVEERNITELLNEFNFGFSQCKRHLNRLRNYIEKRSYGTFRFVKINSNGKKLLEVFS